MKYRLFSAAAAILVLTVTALATYFAPDNPNDRVHQHLVARGPNEGCDCDGEELCTHLPLVIIDTGGEEIPGWPVDMSDSECEEYTTTASGESMLLSTVKILDDEAQNHHPSDEPDLEAETLIRVRGNSSRFFDKPGYLLRFVDSDGDYENHEVMGMDPHYEWALHGPYLDKTLIRNYICYNLSGELMDWAPNVRFCEVIVNGEYQGLYVMTETITNGEDCRADISEPVDKTDQSGYILRLDAGSSEPLKNINNFTYYTYRISRKSDQIINIVYPRSGSLTQDMADAIEQDFSDFEKALYSFDYNDDVYGYEGMIDVSSFVDYFIITEFTCNYDVGSRSTYVSRDIGGKYKMIVWDFNSAFDNYRLSVSDPYIFQMEQVAWYVMLMKDEDFTEKIISRYRQLREGVLSEEYLMNYIDETLAYLGPAIERNFEVWGYTFEEYRPLNPDDRNPDSFEQAVLQLKQSVQERGAWLDEYIEVIRQYSHPSTVKKFNH